MLKSMFHINQRVNQYNFIDAHSTIVFTSILQCSSVSSIKTKNKSYLHRIHKIEMPATNQDNSNSLIISPTKACTITSSILDTATKRGLEYLNNCCDATTGFQNTCAGVSRETLLPIKSTDEVFTSIIALDLLSESLDFENVKNLYKFVMPEHGYECVNFYKTEKLIPDDVDTTALVLAILLRDGFLENGKRMREIARVLFLNKTDDGIIDTYIPPRGFRKNRKDPCTVSNVMRFLYMTGYEMEATDSEQWLFECLQSGSYITQFEYYASPETFLYFISKAIILDKRALYKFEDDILEHIHNIFDNSIYPMDIAMRILALDNLKKLNRSDFKTKVFNNIDCLVKQQQSDGSWPKDALFKKRRSNIYMGGSVISTVFSVAAIQAFQKYYNL